MKLGKWVRLAVELLLLAAVIGLLYRPVQVKHGWHSQVVYAVPTSQKLVALTFDDGPDPRFTPAILDSLDKYHVKATFFMIGKEMVKYPGLAREVIDRGNVVANHTYTHPHDIELDTRSQVANELEKCEAVIERLTGKRAYLFRPPRGLVDGTVFNIAEEEGYTTVLWTVCADHHDAPTPEAMAKRVLQHIKPGAIILAHDGTFNSRWKDVAATPLIIEELQKRGYKFVTVPELLSAAEPASKQAKTVRP